VLPLARNGSATAPPAATAAARQAGRPPLRGGRQVLSCSSLCERKGIGHGSEHSVQCWFSISVAALNVMFNSMNKPSQLSGWKSSGGDPCGGNEEWKGIQCSGKSVTEINLSGLGLSGTLGYQLSSLKSVTKL